MTARVRKSSHVVLWVPAYFCNAVLTLIRCPRVSLNFYPIHGDLSPDWDWIEKRANQLHEPQVFLLVHYFGFPGPTREAETFCDRHGIVLIEDAAHVLQPTEHVGHSAFSLFSPHKLLALPQVGILVVSPQWIEGYEDRVGGAEWRRTLAWAGRGLAKQLLVQLHLPWYRGSGERLLTPTPPCGRLQASGALSPIRQNNPLTLRLLAKAEQDLQQQPCKVTERRRGNYLSLVSRIAGIGGVRPLLPSLPSTVCPMFLPVFIERGCTELVLRLWGRGITAAPWWDVPPEVAADPATYHVACAFYQRVLWLPVHQDLTARHIDLISEAVVAAASDGAAITPSSLSHGRTH